MGADARALVTHLLDLARSRRLSRVTTHAGRTARPVFERLGFVVDSCNDNWVRGQHLPNDDMHRTLLR